LGSSRPSVSSQINGGEHTLGVCLFDRNPQPPRLSRLSLGENRAFGPTQTEGSAQAIARHGVRVGAGGDAAASAVAA